MTTADVKQRVGDLVDVLYDPKQASEVEKKIWYDCLRAISNGECDDPRKCAKLALKTTQLKFKRIY